MSLNDVAEATGIMPPNISIIEAGKKDVQISTAARLADAVGLPAIPTSLSTLQVEDLLVLRERADNDSLARILLWVVEQLLRTSTCVAELELLLEVARGE